MNSRNALPVGTILWLANIRDTTLGPRVYFQKYRIEKHTRTGVWLTGVGLTYLGRTWRNLDSKPSQRFQLTKRAAAQDLLRRRAWYAQTLLRRHQTETKRIAAICAEFGFQRPTAVAVAREGVLL